jgi:hypothetical protein
MFQFNWTVQSETRLERKQSTSQHHNGLDFYLKTKNNGPESLHMITSPRQKDNE